MNRNTTSALNRKSKSTRFVSDDTKLSKKSTWTNLNDRQASFSRLHSLNDDEGEDDDEDERRESKGPTAVNISMEHAKSSTAPNNVSTGSRDHQPRKKSSRTVASNELSAAIDAILLPNRLAALSACDVPVVSYREYSMFRDVFRFRGRNFGMMIAPLLLLAVWDVFWGLLFLYEPFPNQTDELRETIASWGDLIDPLLTPVSFLLVFRLGRAAVRFWDARAAAGKMIEFCRITVSVVAVACMAPRRLHDADVDGDFDSSSTNELRETLLGNYARWTAVFPLAVKNFLRPSKREGWCDYTYYKKRRFEIGPLLSEEDAQKLLSKGGYKEGTLPTLGPVLVLDRLREIASDICFEVPQRHRGTLNPAAQAELHSQLNSHINTLTGAFGAMERIKSTPLPFVYVVHLRMFLLLYLFLSNMTGMAQSGWTAVIALFIGNWALLGIEAAAVECERPFCWNANHLPLGRFCAVIAGNVGQTLNDTRDRSVKMNAKSVD